MRKTIVIMLLILFCIIISIGFTYVNYQNSIKQTINFNKEFEYYYQKELLGTDLTTIINKAVDNNTKNEVKIINEEYIDDEKFSINIEVKIAENDDQIYRMEKIYNLGTDQFVRYFGYMKFKCTKIEYHKETKRVKYLLFEQILEQVINVR